MQQLLQTKHTGITYQ